MVDIFESEGLPPPRDIFAAEGIRPPSIQDKNQQALNPPKATSDPEQVMYDELAKSRFSQEKLEEWKSKPIGFFEAKKFLDIEEVLPFGGLKQAYDTYGIMKIAEKQKSGESITPQEETSLNEFIDKTIEMRTRGFSIGGGIAYGAAQMPAFMLEFAATGGAGKAAASAATKIVTSKVAGSIAASAVNVAARTAVMPQRYIPNYSERRLNDFMSVTDKGDLYFKESEETPATSALKAFGYTSAEVASELSGAAIGKYIVDPIKGIVKTPLTLAVNNLPIGIRTSLYNAYKAIQPNATVSKAFSAAGFNGMLAELGEERVADILRGAVDLATDKNYTTEDFLDAITPNKEQLLIEFGIMSIFRGVRTSADIAFNHFVSKGLAPNEAREAVNNLSATETDNIANDYLKIDSTETAGQAFYREFVNRLQPVEDVAKIAREQGAEIQKGQDPLFLSRSYAGIIGIIESNLTKGTTKFDEVSGQYVINGKAIKAIFDDVNNTLVTIEGDKNQIEKDFNEYLIARRTLEDLQGREDVTVAEKDIIKSTKTMANLPTKYGQEFTWFDEFAKETYDYLRRVLYNLVDSGLMSEQQYNSIVEQNPNYISFQRILDNPEFKEAVTSKGVFTDASAKKVIKKIHGSDKEIKDVRQSIIKNTAQILDIAHRNRVARSVADLAEIMPEYVEKIPTPMQKITVTDKETGKEIETYRPSGFAPKDTITVYRDGKKEYYRVSKPLLTAMENLSPAQLNQTMRWFVMPFKATASMLRAGATLNPEFILRNPIRDQMTAFLQSPVRPTPVDMVKGLAAVIGKNELYWDWKRNGGSFNSYMELDDKGLEKAYNELFKPRGKLARYLKNPINILADISGGLEQATRIGAYSKAQKEGFVGIEAALISREATLDFARSGTAAAKINQVIPFFNAGVQSVDKLIRTFKENPKATMLWGMATITIPSVLLTGYYLYGAPEDERQEYLELPQWQKDMFWLFKEDGEWRRLPKPFSFGYLFGSMPERFMIWGYQGDKPEIKKFWQDVAIGMAGTVSPVYDPTALIPPAVKVILEGKTNYNFFTNRDIYPSWMNDLPPEERYTKSTSETAKAIGKAAGISPAIIDNSLRGLLAGSADYITTAGDEILKQVKIWNGEEVPEKPVTPSDRLVIKGFSVREPTGKNTNSYQNFYNDWDEINQIYAAYRDKQGEEKAAYFEKHQQKIQAYKPIKAFYDQTRIIGKQADRVWDDPEMTSQEKVEALSEYGDQILAIVKEANQLLKESDVQ